MLGFRVQGEQRRGDIHENRKPVIAATTVAGAYSNAPQKKTLTTTLSSYLNPRKETLKEVQNHPRSSGSGHKGKQPGRCAIYPQLC